MIEGPNFVWLHLPKTAGTSTAQLFRELNLSGVSVDPDHIDRKHESIQNRLKSFKSNPDKARIITTRRLASWLLSDWHHKTKKMGLKIPFGPAKSGLFYSLRLGGTWVSADYWIHYFNARSCTHTVRVEHLQEDSNRYVLPLLPKGTKLLKFSQQNTNEYSHKIEDFFGRSDLKRIYNNNPAWTAWEKEMYGSTSEINPINRLKLKVSKFFV